MLVRWAFDANRFANWEIPPQLETELN